MRQNCGIWEHTFNVALRELLENQQNKCSQKCNQRCGSTEPYGACALLLLEEHSSRDVTVVWRSRSPSPAAARK